MSIQEEFKRELQSVYGVMLRKHNIKSGDIDPLELVALEEAEDTLADVVAGWIKGGKDV